ncbi:hypothetical protein ACFQZ2_00465 [Streptomonospora algeriensis]|uniref:Uncharacterized protein n=1 Tax=Streptomonospora algeriensis TaxID=995084 RepID=A0ABW3BB39_9ACTN
MNAQRYERQGAYRRRIEEARAKAEAEARAQSILRILDTFAVDLPHDQRETVRTCTDIDLLDALFRDALEIVGAHDDFRRRLTAWAAQERSSPGHC